MAFRRIQFPEEKESGDFNQVVTKCKAKNVVMIAGGTGIAPMLQFVRDVLKDQTDNVSLCQYHAPFMKCYNLRIDILDKSCIGGHLGFWQMAETFTGLKLQGQLGQFGKTSVSDIEGFVQLPDGKIVSGAEWGNILVWDGGLIKVEISREKGKPCHDRKRFPL